MRSAALSAELELPQSAGRARRARLQEPSAAHSAKRAPRVISASERAALRRNSACHSREKPVASHALARE
jgi:hypothetical protein